MTSYLMVTIWQGSNITDQHSKKAIKLIRRVNAFGSKARTLARVYEIGLNNGVDYASNKQQLTKAVMDNSITRYSVCAIPDNQAREYNDYMKWENAKYFEGSENKDVQLPESISDDGSIAI